MAPDDHDVDALLANLDNEGGDAPPTPETPAAPPVEDKWAAPDWAQFEWNGKKVAPDSADKAKTWLSQGYNYSQRMEEHKKAQKALEQTAAKYKGYDRYDEINKYASTNPGWMEFVNQQWQAKTQAPPSAALPPELEPVLNPLLERVSKFDAFLAEQEEIKVAEQTKKHDEALESEIESIRKKYPNIDLTSADVTGVPLERRVLQHANATGIPSFRAAFHDYMSDRLGELASANGREAVVKTQQQAAKTGLLGKTPAPVKGVQAAQNVKAMSYEQLKQEALAELGIT